MRIGIHSHESLHLKSMLRLALGESLSDVDFSPFTLIVNAGEIPS